MIDLALGHAVSVVNVGAGTGSYEPRDRTVFAVEPSATMVRQRTANFAPAARAVAERLPLDDDAVEAALAILTIHHWTDPGRGLSELRRVARKRVVVLTWDQGIFEKFWLVRDYLPCIRDLDRPRALAIGDVVSALGGGDIVPIPVPHDCIDGFLGAFWRRPQAYLDSRVRAAISAFSAMPPHVCDAGLRRLENDIRDGAWEELHRDLLELDQLDLGYRLVVA